MSNKETKDTIVSSLEEYQIFNSFVKDTQEIGHNFSFKSNPNIIFAESSKLDEKKKNLIFSINTKNSRAQILPNLFI